MAAAPPPAKKTMWQEFKEFLNRGDIITIAVGLIMALYFQQILNAVLDGLIKPIIAAIFRKPDLASIGFDIGDARISIGLIIDAILNFVIVAFVLFWILKAYEEMRKTPEEPKPETELSVLQEIRDSLRSGRGPAS